MEPNLGMTNVWLGIIAAVSVLEAMVMIGIGVAGYLVYKRVMELVTTLEATHVVPTMVRVNAILDDVKGVTNTVRGETERVDQAIHSTMDRLDDTADRVRSNVRARTSRLIGVFRAVRAILEGVLRAGSRPHQPSET